MKALYLFVLAGMKYKVLFKKVTLGVAMFSVCLPLFAQWEPDVRLTYDNDGGETKIYRIMVDSGSMV